jgi:hypothetical protein
MYGPKTKRLTVDVSEKLMAKVKGYAAFSNIPLGVFVNRILIDKIKKIEKGEDAYIKIDKRRE